MTLLLYFVTLNPVEPKAQAPPIQDPDIAADVPCIGIEEMLQDLTITDDSRSHDHKSGHNRVDSGGDVIMRAE